MYISSNSKCQLRFNTNLVYILIYHAFAFDYTKKKKMQNSQIKLHWFKLLID